MITILSSPKPFTGRADILQRNALHSWMALDPAVEIILYGNSPGTVEVCREMGLRCVPDIAANPRGIPYFGAIAAHAAREGRHDLQVYLNGDILLTRHLLTAAQTVAFPRFLLVGQRIDLLEGVMIDPASPTLPDELRALAQTERITLHAPFGIDYFLFRRGLWEEVPPLVIGRAGYDSALIIYCQRRQIPIIDATLAVPALHQFHDYSHVPGGIQQIWKGEDARFNKLSGGVSHSPPQISDAGWTLREGTLVASRCRGDHLRALELEYRFVRGWERRALAMRLLWRLLLATRLYQPRDFSLAEVLDAYAATPSRIEERV